MAQQVNLNKTIIEQKLVIVRSDGHSNVLVGELEENRTGILPTDILPSYLNMGWEVISMTPFSNNDSIMVLIQKSQTI